MYRRIQNAPLFFLIKNLKRITELNCSSIAPEKIFSEGVTTSIFIFESGIPQDNKEIFTCYIEDDGLETVKNQGRQDIKDRWQSIEDRWIEIIRKQSGDDTIKWIKPSDYLMFKQGIDVKEFSDKLITKVLYNSLVDSNDDGIISISLESAGKDNE